MREPVLLLLLSRPTTTTATTGRSPLLMSTSHSCPHVQDYRNVDRNVEDFQYLYKLFVIATTPSHLNLKVNRSSDCPTHPDDHVLQALTRCHACDSYSQLYACLQCVYIACKGARHMQQHCKSENHTLGQSLPLSLSSSVSPSVRVQDWISSTGQFSASPVRTVSMIMCWKTVPSERLPLRPAVGRGTSGTAVFRT